MFKFVLEETIKAIVRYVMYVTLALTIAGGAYYCFLHEPLEKEEKPEEFVPKIFKPIAVNTGFYKPKTKPNFWQKNKEHVYMSVPSAALTILVILALGHSAQAEKEGKIKAWQCNLIWFAAIFASYFALKMFYAWAYKKPANLTPSSWKERWLEDATKKPTWMYKKWVCHKDNIFYWADVVVKGLFALAGVAICYYGYKNRGVEPEKMFEFEEEQTATKS